MCKIGKCLAWEQALNLAYILTVKGLANRLSSTPASIILTDPEL